MSSYSRNNAINTTIENELNERTRKNFINVQVNQIMPKYQHSNNQVPKPEPRKKPNHIQNQHISIGRFGTGLEDELAIDNGQAARLVKIRYTSDDEDRDRSIVDIKHQSPETNIKNHLYGREQHDQQQLQKRTSFNEVPVEYTTDEGVSSPTNVEFEDDERDLEDYYDEGDDYGIPEPTGELANLSKQSMVPLPELIAYYQYIQNGNNHNIVSRQSSSTSQETCKTKHSHQFDERNNEAKSFHDSKDALENKSITDDDKDIDTPVTEKRIPVIQFERSDGKELAENDGEITYAAEDLLANKKNEIQVAPKADKRRIRANVVLELINSERDFVKHLKDVVEGYLYPARRHPEIFTGDRISTIFANIEQLYEFQRRFLDNLELHINWEDLTKSVVGRCFLEYDKGFSVYHHYCNNHPNATSELQDLYTKPRFVKFFEACRLLRNMIDISLDGFLLTPIQKICKYPLQLTELLKNTDEDHPDYKFVVEALESMRNCANVANERKRRIEALADVMSFQERVDNWFGPKLCDTSSILIHSGDLSKINSPTWSQNVQLYLFDHLLLYAKRDLLKRNTIILKDRVSMDTVTEISDADEYKPKRSFKLYCSEHQKWFVFVARTEKEKDEWLQAFERERNLVESDENEGFQITEREIGVARRALQNRKHSRSARYRHKRPDTAIVDQLDLDDANMIMNRTLSLPSCIHPSHVMNFVEDSRVVGSTRKKDTSPRSSSRSPNASSQLLSQQQQQQHIQQQQQIDQELIAPASGSWFKKMGSKKLSRSHVYQIHGQTGAQIQSTSAVVSPSSSKVLATAASIVSDDSAAIKYDQLEKRHREHMISEEHARLFRLNNDLPPPQLFARSATPNQSIHESSSSAQSAHIILSPSQHRANQFHHHQQPQQASDNQRRCKDSRFQPNNRLSTHQNQQHQRDLNSCIATDDNATATAAATVADDDDDGHLGIQSKLSLDDGSQQNLMHQTQSSSNIATFEATVLLSSGRVVRVREDAV